MQQGNLDSDSHILCWCLENGWKSPQKIGRNWYAIAPNSSIPQLVTVTLTQSLQEAQESILACVGLPLPPTTKQSPDLVTAGVVQERHANFLIVQEWYFGESDNKNEQWLNAHVNVVCWEEIQGFDCLDEIAQKHGISMFFIDIEPEIQLATNYALKHLPGKQTRRTGSSAQVYLVDPVELKNKQCQPETMRIQSLPKEEGTEITIYKINQSFALDYVKQRICKHQFHLPAGLVYDPKDPSNLIYHYLASERLLNGRWVERKEGSSHWFNASSLAEIGVQFSR
jgi:hypothetical protein